jgi:hypothetical protein
MQPQFFNPLWRFSNATIGIDCCLKTAFTMAMKVIKAGGFLLWRLDSLQFSG